MKMSVIHHLAAGLFWSLCEVRSDTERWGSMWSSRIAAILCTKCVRNVEVHVCVHAHLFRCHAYAGGCVWKCVYVCICVWRPRHVGICSLGPWTSSYGNMSAKTVYGRGGGWPLSLSKHIQAIYCVCYALPPFTSIKACLVDGTNIWDWEK